MYLSVFQTPGLWIDEGAEQGSPHQRSASWGSADHLKEVGSPVTAAPDNKRHRQWVNTRSSVCNLSDSKLGQSGLKHSHSQSKEHVFVIFEVRSIYSKCVLFVRV